MAIATMLTKNELETRILQVSGDIHSTVIWSESEPGEAARLPALQEELAALEKRLEAGDFAADPVELNANGNEVTRRFLPHLNRYAYDLTHCRLEDGWQQFDTYQDASYFGVWVQIEKLQVLTFAEGDEILVQCATPAALRRELDSMERFYGKPPASFVCYSAAGVRSEFVCARPHA